MVETIMLFLFCVTLPIAKGAAPGTFFWKPRLGLDLAIPTTQKTIIVHQPNIDNIKRGLVVLIDGYTVGTTIIVLAVGFSIDRRTFTHLSPTSASYYTNVYRWSLRHLSLIPDWLSGNTGNYVETHKAWKKRFYYMDKFVPKWLRKLFFFIKKEEWDKEESDFKNFKHLVEPAFGKHYRFPHKRFNDFRSWETLENVDESNIDDVG